MCAKRKKFETRTLLMVLLVIVVIAAIVIVVINLPVEENTLTPEEVLRNPNKYLNSEPIFVKGYYINSTGIPHIVSTLDNTEGRAELKIDYSSVSNVTLISGSNYVYRFKGILTVDEENPLIDRYILVVEDIIEV